MMATTIDALRLAGAHLPALALSLARLGLWLALLAAIFVPLERLWALHPAGLLRPATGTDLGYYFLNGLLPSLLLGAPLALVAWVGHALVPAGVTAAIARWPMGWRLAAAVLVSEVGFYWGHRWSHASPLLWRFHAIHHSAAQMDWLVNTRAHPVDMIFTRLCGLVPLYVVGLAAPAGRAAGLIPVLVLLVGTIWGFLIHANVRWRSRLLEQVIATPAFHHWHHANDDPARPDRNYAAMLPLLDRLFGTWHLPPQACPARYGIDRALPAGLGRQLLEPFAPSRPDGVVAGRAGGPGRQVRRGFGTESPG